MVDYETELGTTDRKEQKVKDVYCQVIPQFGGEYTEGQSGVEYVTTILKIRCRKKSIKNIKTDMYFKDREDRKYEIIEWLDDYKTRSFIEIKARIIYE